MIDIIVMPSRVLDHDYRAVLNHARSLGYTLPTSSLQQMQSQFMRSLKYGGAWVKLDAYWMYANNGSQEFSTINWKNPSVHQVTIVNSTTWARNVGFTGNGTDMYVDTNYNPSTQGVNYTQNNAGRFMWAFSSTTFTDGTTGNANRFSNANTSIQRINQSTASLDSAADLSGGVGERQARERRARSES